MTKEEIYAQQLKDMGVYKSAFEPEIKTLAQLERELRRAQKAWKDAYDGETPQQTTDKGVDVHYALILSLRKDILVHRDALGLTPKGFRKLSGGTGAQDPAQERNDISACFDKMFAEVDSYDKSSPT